MKGKIMIGVLIAIIALLVIWLMYARFSDMFKPTVHLQQFNADEVQRIEVAIQFADIATFDELDRGKGTYTDRDKIRKIVDFFNSISLVRVELEEEKIRPNQSPNGSIWFYGDDSEIITGIILYGGSFIRENHSGQYYRSKNERVLIKDALIQMTFD